MSVTLLPVEGTLTPFRVSISASWIGSRVGALIGFKDSETTLYGMILCEDGRVALLGLSDFTIDWRYDVETDQWVDANARGVAETSLEI